MDKQLGYHETMIPKSEVRMRKPVVQYELETIEIQNLTFEGNNPILIGDPMLYE